MRLCKIPALFIVLSLCAAGAGRAQNLSTEVVVDRTVETYLPEAKPLKNVFPELLATPTPDFNLKPANYSLWADFNPLVPTGSVPDYTGIAAPDNHRGYVWLGYFPSYNLGVAAGYRFVDSESTRIGAALNFGGYSYKNKLTGHSIGDNAFKFSLFADHLLNNGLKLGAYVGYSFDGIKNPGTYTGYDSQTIGNFFMKLAASRTTDELAYHADLDFRYFSMGKDLSPRRNVWDEPYARLDAGFLSRVSDVLSVGADLEGTMLSSHDRMGLGAFTPKAVLRGSNYEVSLGIRLDLAVSTPGDKFHVAPEVSAVLQMMPQAALYADIKGGNRLQTLYNLYCFSPFAPRPWSVRPSYCPIDGELGVRLGSFGGLRFDIFGGWTKVNNAVMPVAGINNTYASMSFVPLDLSGWRAGISAAYSYNRVFDAAVSFAVGPEGLASDDGQYFDRAKYTLGASVKLHPAKTWNVEVRYKLRGGRRYSIAGNKNALYDMDAMSDLGFGATWNISSRLGIFLNVDNILNSRPQLLPGLSAQGLHGLLGADFRF